MNNKSKSKSESIQEILYVLCKEKVARCYSIDSNCDFLPLRRKTTKRLHDSSISYLIDYRFLMEKL